MMRNNSRPKNRESMTKFRRDFIRDSYVNLDLDTSKNRERV